MGGSGSPAPSTTRPAAGGLTEVGIAPPGATAAAATLPDRGRSGTAKSGAGESGFDESGLDETGLAESGVGEPGLTASGLGNSVFAAPMVGADADRFRPPLPLALAAVGKLGAPINFDGAEAGGLSPLMPLAEPVAGGLERSALLVDPSGDGCGGKPAAIRWREVD